MTKMGKANGESGCLLGNNSSSVTRVARREFR